LLGGVDYLSLYGEDPSAIERAFAILLMLLSWMKKMKSLNAKYTEKRAADYIRSFCAPSFLVNPPFEDWEIALY